MTLWRSNGGEEGALALVRATESRAPLDWVLRMESVPPGQFLEAIIDSQALDSDVAVALADCVAQDHAARPRVRLWDSAAALASAADGCIDAAREAGLADDRIEQWRQGFRIALAKHAGWLALRAATGRVRRCHGDLHAGNILFWNNAPVLFDALEFDETLATIDVGYDLAFLLMDLDQRAGRWAANRVFNRYIARTGDADIAQGMPMFMSLRAVVRAIVEAGRGHGTQACAYLSAACSYLLPGACVLIAIGGLPGSGKSTLARRLAPRIGDAPGAVVLGSDETRKRRHRVAPETRLPEAAYSASSTAATRALLMAEVRRVLRGGHAVIVDMTFIDSRDRETVAMLGRAQGVRVLGLWLDAPLSVLQGRVRGRTHDASDADEQVLAAADARPKGQVSWLRVDASSGDAAFAVIDDMLRGTGILPPSALALSAAA